MEKDSEEFDQTYIRLGIIAHTQVSKDTINILCNSEYNGAHGKEVRFDKLPGTNNEYSAAYINKNTNIPPTKGFEGFPVGKADLGSIVNIIADGSVESPDVIRVVKSETNEPFIIYVK